MRKRSAFHGFTGQMRLERIGPQLLEEIAFSGKPLKQIAAERKLSIEAVQRTSSLYGLRSRARTLSILSKVLSRAASERSAVQRKAMVPRKFFSVEEKTRLLKEHRFGILGVAKGYWAFQRTKEHFGAFDAFLNDLNNHVFFGLDYYDPGMKGPSGKPKSVLGWMRESARRFCANTNTSLLHQEKLAKQTDFSRSGVRSALAAEELPAGIKWIPCFTKTFLKTLGLDIGIVAKLGYADVERLILGIVESPATGLSEEQVWLAKQKLAGQSNEEIGKALGGITKEAVRQKLGLVVQRMKLHLPRINP